MSLSNEYQVLCDVGLMTVKDVLQLLDDGTYVCHASNVASVSRH